MIFYLSGTGNSKYVAEQLSKATDERMIAISVDTMKQSETYTLDEKENIGFVFPVYWYTLPTLLERFIKCLSISGYKDQYVYALVTYGLSGGTVMNRLKRLLAKKNIRLNAEFGVAMIDNYVVAYNVAEGEKRNSILSNAVTETEKITQMVMKKEKTSYLKRGSIAFLSPITGLIYRSTKHQKKFRVTETCNSCGQCARECPCNVIHMDEGKPSWGEGCTFCLKCIHHCKQSAVQYGRGTKKRNRYVCPL